VPAWKAWAKAKGLRVVVRKEEDKNSLECEFLRLRIEEQERINAEGRGELCSRDEVIEVLSAMMVSHQAEMRKLKNELAITTAGGSVPENAKAIGQAVLQALQAISLGEWAKKKVFWRYVSPRLSDLLRNYSLGSGESSMPLPQSASV
jgi:hypothetical protein